MSTTLVDDDNHDIGIHSDRIDNGELNKLGISNAIYFHKNKLERDPGRIKFLCSFKNDEYEDIVTYNEIMNHIEKDNEDPQLWKFRRITAHKGPLATSHPSYKESRYNFMVEWETGEITSEPLKIIAADDPVTCTIYEKNKNLLEEECWKRLKSIARRQPKLLRLENQAKLRLFRLTPK